MKKIFLLLIAILATLSIKAQEINVYENGTLSATYVDSPTNIVKVIFEEGASSTSTDNPVDVGKYVNFQLVKVYVNGKVIATYLNSPTNIVEVTFKRVLVPDPDTPTTDANLLPGKFSVSETKKVQFTKGNLYWDGCDFRFEANQTDHPAAYDAEHIGNFYWTNLTDYQSGNADYMPYRVAYNYSSRSTSDKFWCGEENPLTVEGTDDLYALSSAEWDYIINGRTNANNLYKYGVAVTNGEKLYKSCLIIAPDDFTGELQSSYTLDEVNAAGLVCLPGAGLRMGTTFELGDDWGFYWSATPTNSSTYGEYYAFALRFYSNIINSGNNKNGRLEGLCLRLAKDAEASEPEPGNLITAITLEPTELTLTTGDSYTLRANFEPVDADNQDLQWTSSDESVATVEGCIVTAVGPGTATITCAATDGSGVTATCVITVTSSDVPDTPTTGDNLLPGKFSVSATKKVQFTRSNLYWNGSDFRFEANQTDYPTAWDANHVGHFMWGKTAAKAYGEYFGQIEYDPSDQFFADGSDADHMLTVDGTSKLYLLSSDEWCYLLEERPNVMKLYKLGVTVTNGETSYEDCIVIAPDDYDFTTTPLASSYTLDEVNKAGLVCLPAAGYRSGHDFNTGFGTVPYGLYWFATPHTAHTSMAYYLEFSTDYGINPPFQLDRSIGCSIRLAKDAEASEPEPGNLITAITLEPTELTLTTGDSYTLRANFEPVDADNQDLQWTSSDESVATVEGCIVTAVGPGTATITCAATDGSGVTATCVITVTSSDVPDTPTTGDNLLPGKFSVSATKKVQFTRSNLYWNGSDFRFEANQTDYPTSWDANHVGHFYWTNLTDYQSGNEAYMPYYAGEYSYSNQSTDDKFWCGKYNPLTVDGTSDLYALSSWDWDYIINGRTNASNLYKYGVTVTNGETIYQYCLIIAPDDYDFTTNPLTSSYTLEELNALGLVCLPNAGCRGGRPGENMGTSCNGGDITGLYWSSSPQSDYSVWGAYALQFMSASIITAFPTYRSYGYSIRLVKDAEASEPQKEQLVTSITVMPSSLTLSAGVSAALMATVSPSDADNQTLSWTSSDESVAIVADGVVTTIAVGTATITATATDGSGVSATCIITVTSSDVPTVTGDNLLPGKFSVSATKKVQFTKANLYWNGSDFRFEANQTDYPTEWDANHVGHFLWTSLTDLQSGNASMPFDEELAYSNPSASDRLWCGEDNPLTVEGTDSLYVLSGMLLSAPDKYNEWQYLMLERTNASNLYKFGVTVTNGEYIHTNCLIIAPDDFTGELQSSYTLDEVNAAGLVCLPAAGYRDGQMLVGGDKLGLYWSSTPDENDLQFANCLCFDRETLMSANFLDHGIFGYDGFRKIGHAIRLAKLVEISEPSTEPTTDPETETEKLVTAITLSQSSLSVPVSSTILLSATVSPSNATKPYLRWSSDNEDVAVAYDSIIVTKAVGTATITCAATDGSGVTATCTITVYDPDANDNDNSGSIDGREYIDLGLPSGTMWATCNVGAEVPEGYGEYFAWGETAGSGSGKTVFDWEHYKLCNNGEADQLNKYCTKSKFGTVDNKTELDVEDDAAYVNWGSNWRIPSIDQLNELREYCTWTWTALETVSGYTVTGTNGNSIFLPAAGRGSFTGEAYGMGTDGGYWTRTLNLEGYSDYAYHYGFTSDYIGNETACRFCGYTIRPVLNTEK